MPLGKDKCVIEREKALDLLDELRSNLPSEIKAAREIVEKRNDLLASVKKDAENLRQETLKKVRELVDNNEISLQARAQAKETAAQAAAQAAEVKRAANTYCEDLLRRTEESVAANLDELRKIRAQFQSSTGVK